MLAAAIRKAGWKMTRGGSGEQSREALPKNLIRPLPYRITKATGSGDLLSQTPVHAGDRDGVYYGGGARHEVAKPRLVRYVTAHAVQGNIYCGSGNPNIQRALTTSNVRVG